ncbi:MAG TPA: impB/mucB/samB family protein [Alphaproteobacteria bacterium]
MDAFNPPSPTGARWLFIDMNSYFASCEQQENPKLRGKPVIVVPMMTDGTCAIAASYEAKKYGIKTGTNVGDAKRMCPDLKLVMARHDVYTQYHERWVDEIDQHTPLTKVWSIDEASCKLEPRNQTIDAAMRVAQNIKDGLRKNIGECIRCSIGVAPNGYLGKIASNMQKPDGLVVLEGRNLPGPLLDLDLSDLIGVGPNMEKRLQNAGIWSMKQLWDLSPKHLRAIWRSVEGERFWYKLHGYEIPDIETGKSVVGHSRVLDPELRAPDKALDVTRRLTTKACQRLRRYNMYASNFSLSVRDINGRRWGNDLHLHPAQDSLTFVRILQAMWDQMLYDLGSPPKLKKVSISLYGLSDIPMVTGDLFDVQKEEPRADPLKRSMSVKSAALSVAMDKITRDYGPHIIHFGANPKTAAGFVGTKIAFSRIPDIAEFSE